MSKNKFKFLLVPLLLLSFAAGKAQDLKWIPDDGIRLSFPEGHNVVAFISDFASFLEIKNMPIYLTANGQVNAPVPNASGYILEFKLLLKMMFFNHIPARSKLLYITV